MLLMWLAFAAFPAAAQTLDFGDFSPFGSASSTVNSKLKIGSLTDAEAASTTSAQADGDDVDGSDDEEGVTLPASVVQGTSGSMTVKVTNTTGATAFLNVWIDWNNNGTLTDSGEQVASNTTITTGTSGANRTINFTAPAAAVTGKVGVRVRLTSVSSPGPEGTDGKGEVEDHLLTVVPPFAFVVVNYNNNTISRFNGANGALLATWSPSGLSSPNYGYRLSDNTLLVANGSSNTITKYNPFTGAYLGTLVTSGNGLNFPYQMAVGADGSIYIANQNGGNVLHFDQDTGAVLGTVLSTTKPAGFVFDTAGQMYVTQNTSGGSLRLYNGSGVFQSTIVTWPSGEYPRGLAWGPDGRLYVNVRNNNSSTGRVDAITFPARTKATFVNMDSGSNPYTGIKWGPDGNLYVVDYGENELQVYSPSGATVRTVTSSLSGPHAVAFTDISPATQDFGDYSGFASASSDWSTALRLGNESDTETAARNSDTANGDDIDDIDDEEGVILPETLAAGTSASVSVRRLNTSGSTAYLNAWIDFNNNGDLTDAGEQIIVNKNVPNGTQGTAQTYNFSVPVSAQSGLVGARFRLSSTSNPGPTGSSGSGEVEDYMVMIMPATTDFGDYAGFAVASSNANNALRIGALVDTEAAAVTNASANGDDNTLDDDEDGVTVPTTLAQGAAASLVVNVTNISGSSAFINAWIDFNGNGTLTDPGEQVAVNTAVATGSSNSNRTVNFTVPATAKLGVAGVRVRLTSVSSPGPDGADGNGEVEDYTTTIVCPVVSITTSTLTAGTVGTSYSQTLAASGGSTPYTWAVTSGTLPAGLSLNANTGVIAGTPTSGSGVSSSLTFRVTDANGCQGTSALSLQVCPLISVGPRNLPNGSVGVPYLQTVHASGGAAPYSLAQTGGALPPGLTFTGCNHPIIGPGTGYPSIFSPAANATVNPPDGLITLALGGSAGPVNSGVWSLKATGGVSIGVLGLGLTESGSRTELTGTSLKFGVSNNSSSLLGMLGVGTSIISTWEAVAKLDVPGPAVSLKPGLRYAVTFHVDGQNGFLESGLGLIPTFTVELLDGAGRAMDSTSSGTLINILGLFGNGVKSGTRTLYFDVPYDVAAGPCSLRFRASAALNTTILGLGTTYATISDLRMTEAVSEGNDDGIIAGTPTAPGLYTIQVTATDANGCATENPVSIIICSAISLPAITTTPAAGVPYSASVAATGGAGPYVYTVSSGALPTGLNLNANTGEISGISTSTTTANFTITANDANSCAGSRSYTITPACPALTIQPSVLATGSVGVAYSQTLSASHGVAPYTWSTVSGAWPAGLSLSAAGVISGIPTSANGSGVNVMVRATDKNGCFSNQVVAVKICPAISLSAIPASQTVGIPFSATVTASGGAAPYVYSMNSGSLPAGLSFNASTGSITGTPTSNAAATFSITATDGQGCSGSRSYTVTPTCPTLSTAPGTLPIGVVGVAYSQALSAVGGAAPYSYSLSSGALPAGLTLSASGLISGTPTTAISSVISLAVTDSNGCQTVVQRTLVVSNAAPSCPTELGETLGGSYRVTRLGRDVFGGENTGTGTCIYNMSPNGRWITGVRAGLKSRGFVMSTLSFANTDVPLVNAAHPYAMGADVNDHGDVVGYEKWSSGGKFNVIAWHYVQATGSVVRLQTPYDANPSVYASPCALTADGDYAFGTVDPDGPGGPILPQGGWWNLNSLAWTAIPGVREVIDASSAGTRLLVVDSSGVGKVLEGHPLSGWSSTLVSFTGGRLRGGRISPNGRYIGSSQRIAGVPTPFVYDLQTSTRTNLALILPQDSLGGIVGAISDTGRVLGSVFSSAATGSFAVMWDTPADLYTRISEVLVSDGHVAQDETYALWNLYNGGDGISADGNTLGVYGNNPTGLEDSIVFSRVPQPDARLCLGNAVWQDTNRNGIKDAGEPGVSGAVLHLIHPGSDNAIGGTGSAADYEVASAITTGSSGGYVFSAISAGTYYVRMTPPATLPSTSGLVVSLDNGVNNDNNGSQPGGPGTDIYSPLITLTPGTEPVNDGDASANTDLSVDFGLNDGVSVGDLVFDDSNGDGIYQSGAGESGIANVTVQLLDGATETVLLSTTTDAEGRYFFGACAPGTYRIRIPTPPASRSAATLGVNADNGVDNDSNGIQMGGPGTAIVSPVITLASGSEPGSTGNTSFENTIDFGLRSCATITVSPASLPGGGVGTSYSASVSATGGTGPYTFAVSSGALPAGLSLNASSGAISGTLTSAAATTFIISASDADNCIGSRSYSITPVCPTLAITPVSLPAGLAGVAYSQTLSASGGTAPYTWSTLSGSWPAGLSLGTDGVISGTPSAGNGAGVSITVRATDAYGCSRTQVVSVKICPVVTLTAITGTAQVGAPYASSVAAAGGAAPYVYALTSGSLPAGLSLDAASGSLSGTPTASGVASFTLSATDANGCVGVLPCTLNVCALIALSPIQANATAGQSYTSSASASGGAAPYAYALTSGSLPAGLSLDTASGTISGTPTDDAAANFTLTATDANGCSGSRAYTITAGCPVITFGGATPPNAYLNTAYTHSLAATGGTAPYAYTLVSGSLPSGLTLAADGTVSGTPTALGTRTVTVRATDAYSCQSAVVSVTFIVKGMALGNQIWVDMNDDGLRGTTESGMPNLSVELWSPGGNGVRDNGSGDDVMLKATTTDANGYYLFTDLVPGSYYVRLSRMNLFYPKVSTQQVALDNGVNNDNNGIQGASGDPVVTPLITLSPGTESVADGDDADTDSTVDIGFSNFNPCQITNLIDNPSFEFQGLPNTTGTPAAVLGFDGTGTSLGANINAFQWVGGANGSSGLGEPMQRVQVAVGNSGSKVSWVESLKSCRHGKRMLLMQGTSSGVALRPAGGGAGAVSCSQAKSMNSVCGQPTLLQERLRLFGH